VVKLIIRWVRHVALIGKQCCIEGLVGKPEGKGLLVRPGHRWKDNIQMNIEEE